ncbi:MAG TPA: DUF4236 domain-containing protein [Pseudonocardiaceae bacterium]|nr:DUF4236 domain-containing protein [Pseudonocardiaceae bacterium]
MPLTFRKSIRILPGVRLNINKKSWSITTGGKNGPGTPTAARAAARHPWTSPVPSAGAAPPAAAAGDPGALEGPSPIRTPWNARSHI